MRRAPQLAKYEVLEELGHGGMATVYRARDRRLGRRGRREGHPSPSARFAGGRARASTPRRRRWPSSGTRTSSTSTTSANPTRPISTWWSPWCAARRCASSCRSAGRCPPKSPPRVGLELLAALAHANSNGVVHRDVKPENVLVERRPSSVLPSDGRAGPGAERPAGRREADRLRDRQAPRRAGRDVNGPGAREPCAHGARADRGGRGRRSLGRLRRRRSPLRVHGRSPPIRRGQSGAGLAASPRRRVPRGASRAPDRRRGLERDPRSRARSRSGGSLLGRERDARRHRSRASPARCGVPGARSRGMDRGLRRPSTPSTRDRIIDRLCVLAGDARESAATCSPRQPTTTAPSRIARTTRTSCGSSRG